MTELAPHITVVTGTYNRANTLQKLVKSIRETIPAPIRWEHIVIDNGSSDGTPKWVQSQKDLRLIQLGKPMGAIHAFTKGAGAAKAPFVLLATDDITFPANAIMRAYVHLIDNPNCGAVTFAHNKKRNEYKPDMHPVMKDGKRGVYPYPQIALVRKWLGDKCDWWGANTGMKGAFTYGGDNWLGANIIEYGYSIDVVEGAVNNEAYINDAPRKMNQAKHRADAQMYFDNFPDYPTLRTTPTIPQQNGDTLRILYIAHWLNKRSRREKRALVSACERVGAVVEFDYYNNGKPLEPDALKNVMQVFKPHLVFSQIHNQNVLTPAMIAASRRASPETVWINWVGDYWPDKVYRKNIELWKQFDALLCVNMDMIDEMSKYVPTFPYLNTYEEPDDKSKETEEYDIVFLGNAYSDARYDLWKMLDRLRTKYKVGIFGKVYQGREPITSDGVNHYDYAAGRAIYKRAKLAINTNEFAATGYTSNRYFEIIASGGALCLHQRTPQFGKYTKSKDGTHYVQWTNLADLEAKIVYWLSAAQDKRRDKIAANALKHAKSKHSADERIKYVLSEIVPKLGTENGK